MWLLIAATLLTAAPEIQVKTLAGQTVAGGVVELNDERLVVQAVDGPRAFATKQLLAIAPTSPAAQPQTVATAKPSVWIDLVDESRLPAVEYTVTGGRVKIRLAAGPVVELPAKAVATVSFREHAGPLAAQWDEILKVERTGDLIVIRKNNALDYLTGVVKDVTAESVQFELDGELLPVKRTKVDGLLYHAAPQTLPDARCVVSDAAGGRVRANSVKLAEGKLRVVSPAGLELDYSLPDIARIDYSQGNLQYLSDMKPESTTWTPYLGAAASPASAAFYRPRADRALEGGPLRVGGKKYAKGLSIHSRTELVYRLPGKFSRFQAVAGIDDSMRGSGNVRLLVTGDDRKLLDEVIAGKDAPRAVDLDIGGVNRLKITVDYGEDLDVSDHLDLCEARILK
jgi:NPCBM/NEW2 domain